jgi:hypothetical protein
MLGRCYAVSFMLTVAYAECHKLALYAECHCAEFRYAECRYSECCDAILYIKIF